jgi:hypothetical protein
VAPVKLAKRLVISGDPSKELGAALAIRGAANRPHRLT